MGRVLFLAPATFAGDLLRRPDMREHALGDVDLPPLWDAYPDLRAAIEESLERDDVAPIQKWLDDFEAMGEVG